MAEGLHRFVEYNSARIVTANPRNFLWDGARPAAELDLSEYDEPTIDPGFQQPIRRYFAGGELVFDANVWDYVAYYYIRDHLGSVRAVTNEDGAVVARYDYDPYGKPRLTWHSGELDPLTGQPIQFDFLFTGHLYHAKSGLYFAPFRAYDPELGRWISRDPIDVAGGINLYEYVGGDPANAVDPSGLREKAIPFHGQPTKEQREEIEAKFGPGHWDYSDVPGSIGMGMAYESQSYSYYYPDNDPDIDNDGIWNKDDEFPKNGKLPGRAGNSREYTQDDRVSDLYWGELAPKGGNAAIFVSSFALGYCGKAAGIFVNIFGFNWFMNDFDDWYDSLYPDLRKYRMHV